MSKGGMSWRRALVAIAVALRSDVESLEDRRLRAEESEETIPAPRVTPPPMTPPVHEE